MNFKDSSSTEQNKAQSGMLPNYYDAAYLKASRDWFSSFVKYTNEKKNIGAAIKHLVHHAHSKGYFAESNKILDIGCGAGELVSELIEAFNSINSTYQYFCIEYNAKSAVSTRALLAAKGVNGVVLNENAFAYDLSKLASGFDFILLSHALYYAKDVSGFMQSLMELKNPDGIMMLVHEYHDSHLNKLRSKFDGPVNYKTEKSIEEFLSQHTSNYIAYQITSNIAIGDYKKLMASLYVRELENLKHMHYLQNLNEEPDFAQWAYTRESDCVSSDGQPSFITIPERLELYKVLEFIVHRPLAGEEKSLTAEILSTMHENCVSISSSSNVHIIGSSELIDSYDPTLSPQAMHEC